jgi:hypothetical protein
MNEDLFIDAFVRMLISNALKTTGEKSCNIWLERKKTENIDVYAFERCDDNDSGNGFISILSSIYDVQRKLGTQFIHTFSREQKHERSQYKDEEEPFLSMCLLAQPSGPFVIRLMMMWCECSLRFVSKVAVIDVPFLIYIYIYQKQ